MEARKVAERYGLQLVVMRPYPVRVNYKALHALRSPSGQSTARSLWLSPDGGVYTMSDETTFWPIDEDELKTVIER